MNPSHNHEDDTVAVALLQQLAERDVPPMPESFDSQVQQRLNAALLATQLFDFAWRVLPQAFLTFLGSVVYFVLFSVTGRMRDETRDPKPTSE